MAEEIAKTGASVVVSARRKELLVQTVEQITELGGKCNFVSADLSYVKHIPELVEQVSTSFGPLNILVNAEDVNPRGVRGKYYT